MVGEETKEGEGRVVLVYVAEYKLVESQLLVVVGDVDEDAGGAGDRRRGGGERRRGRGGEEVVERLEGIDEEVADLPS